MPGSVIPAYVGARTMAQQLGSGSPPIPGVLVVVLLVLFILLLAVGGWLAERD